MNKTERAKILTRIRELIKTAKSYQEIKEMSTLYGNIDGPYPDKFLIVLSGRKNIIEFENLCGKLWKSNKEIHKTISYKKFKKGIIENLRKVIENDFEFDSNVFIEYLEKLLTENVSKYEIFKEIKGCKITSKKPLIINDFCFYNWPNHSKHITEKHKTAFEKNNQSFYYKEDKKALVSFSIDSRDYDRANEIADQKFKQLENILRFIFTNTNHSNQSCNLNDVGFFEHREQEWLESKVIYDEHIGGHSIVVGTYRNINLNKSLLTGSKKLKKIWELLQKPNISKLETRILNSLEWIGKAKHELEPEKEIVQFLFAIEALINFNEQGIISPGVAYGMKESIAFLLGKNPKERMEIDETFSRLYSIRSSIVHGSLKEFSKYDIEDAKNLSERIVFLFLENPKLIELGVDGIKYEIKKRKYASS